MKNKFTDRANWRCVFYLVLAAIFAAFVNPSHPYATASFVLSIGAFTLAIANQLGRII